MFVDNYLFCFKPVGWLKNRVDMAETRIESLWRLWRMNFELLAVGLFMMKVGDSKGNCKLSSLECTRAVAIIRAVPKSSENLSRLISSSNHIHHNDKPTYLSILTGWNKKNLEKRDVRSHNNLRLSARTLVKNKVRFARAEQLWCNHSFSRNYLQSPVDRSLNKLQSYTLYYV